MGQQSMQGCTDVLHKAIWKQVTCQAVVFLTPKLRIIPKSGIIFDVLRPNVNLHHYAKRKSPS